MSANPAPLGGPSVWFGRELAESGSWTYRFSTDDIAEIDHALEFAGDCSWWELGAEEFPLSNLKQVLATAARELEYGRGFQVFKGLPVHRLTLEQCKMVLMGLSGHLGTPVYQSASGEIIGEIRDEGSDVGVIRGQMTNADGTAFLSSRARAQSTRPLRWHTDRADLVGLLSIGTALSGGRSRIASAVTIHDEMVARAPYLASLLYQDVVRSRLGEEKGGAHTVYALPVFTVHESRFASHYSRTYVEAAQKLPGVPTMTDAQWEALDLLSEIADETCLEMELKPGDMQFLNNHVIYHARDAFCDDPGQGRIRRLLRIWLSARVSRALDPRFGVLFGDTGASALRGGIRADEACGTVKAQILRNGEVDTQERRYDIQGSRPAMDEASVVTSLATTTEA